MKTLPRIALVFSSVALTGLIFVQMHGQASAGGEIATPSAALSTMRHNEAPLVALPDFTRLVEQAGPAVVNIEATMSGGKDNDADDRDHEMPMDPNQPEIPEIFKRFFGQPGAPGAPGAPGPQRPRPRGTSMGSGFIISPDGYVLTNHHVIDHATEVIVHLTDRREFKAKVVGSDENSDVAVLKIEATGLPVLRLSDSHSLKPGQWVLAIGSPFGFDHSVTAGVVSGLGRPSMDGSQRYVPFIQTDVAINRGNSGGPLLNTNGEVVGINSQIFSNSGGYMGVSFAIPIEVAMNAVSQIQKTGHVTRGQLGVKIGDIQREQMAELGMTRAAGAFVGEVLNNSAAAKAGIRPGDVIVAFNGKDIGNSSELPPLVGSMPPGSRVTLKVLRDGKSINVPVVLSTLDESVASTDNKRNSDKPAATGGSNPIGVEVGEVDAGLRGKLGLSSGEGVRITKITGPLARQVGLSVGDVILQVGKTPVGSSAQFASAMKNIKPGDRLRLLLRNADSTSLVTVMVP